MLWIHDQAYSNFGFICDQNFKVCYTKELCAAANLADKPTLMWLDKSIYDFN